MIDPNGNESRLQYPCFEHATLSDLLDAKSLSWRYYAPLAGGIWTGPTLSSICAPARPGRKTSSCTRPGSHRHCRRPACDRQLGNSYAAKPPTIPMKPTALGHPGSPPSSMPSATVNTGPTPPSSSPGMIGEAGTTSLPHHKKFLRVRLPRAPDRSLALRQACLHFSRPPRFRQHPEIHRREFRSAFPRLR